MTLNALTPEEYYADTDYLSNSALNHFVSFDYFGNPTYNIHEFLNPPKMESDAILIGSLTDRILTEWFNLDSEYGPQLDKAGLQDELTMMGVEFKKADTNPILRQLLVENGYIFKKELKAWVRDTILTLVEKARSFQYDATTTLMEFIKESDAQMIITNEEWGMRGKFDFINHKRSIISDLKTTWNLERALKEMIYQGKPNIYHKYVRQLAIYQELYYRESGVKYQTELIFIDYRGHHRVVRIGQKALDKALEQVNRDIDVLRSICHGERPYIETIDITDADTLVNPEALIDPEVSEEDSYLSDKD